MGRAITYQSEKETPNVESCEGCNIICALIILMSLCKAGTRFKGVNPK